MTEDPTELLQDLQAYFAHLHHLGIDGAPAVELVKAQAPRQEGHRGPSRSQRPQRRPSSSSRHRPKAERPRPSFAQGGEGDANTDKPKKREVAPRATGPTWKPGASSATLAPRQDPKEILASLKETTQLPNGEAHLLPHGVPATLIVVEAIAMEGERRERQAPYSGRIGQMLEQLLKRVMGVSPQEVCLIQALESADPQAQETARGQLEALVRGAMATRVLGFGAYTERLLLPKGGARGEGEGRFGRLGGAQVLITHGLEEMNGQPALKRPAYQDLLEFQRRIERRQS